MGFLIRFHKNLSILLNLICENNWEKKRIFTPIFCFDSRSENCIWNRNRIPNWCCNTKSLFETILGDYSESMHLQWKILESFYAKCYVEIWGAMQSLLFSRENAASLVPPCRFSLAVRFFKFTLRVTYPIAAAFLLACDKQRAVYRRKRYSYSRYAINHAGFPGNDVFALTLLSCPRS